MDYADKVLAVCGEFGVDCTLRTTSQLDDLVDGDALIAALEKQVCCDLLNLAVSNLSSRPFISHSSPRPEGVKEIFNAPQLESFCNSSILCVLFLETPLNFA